MPVKADQKIRLLSNELREIIACKPAWILRNGMSLYVIIIGCLITITFFISYPDIIAVNAKIFSIQRIPPVNSIISTDSNYYAEVYISKSNINKVEPGQKVLLKLQPYPFEEYGVIEGTLGFISKIADDSGYLAKVILPNGLRTNHDKQIQYSDGLLAQGEIITADVKLSDRLLNQFKPFIKKP